MKLLRSESGSIFIVVFFVLSILFVFIALIMSISASELRSTRLSSDVDRAYYIAVSGIEAGRAVIGAGNWQTDGGFAGGSGEEDNPFLVANAMQLDNVRNFVTSEASLYFKQIADIDLSGFNNGEWDPIEAFKHIYNGNGYVIQNLHIDNPLKPDVGLFRSLIEGQLKNIGLIEVEVSGAEKTGGLVGYNERGEIKNCFVQGVIRGSRNKVGGVVGYNYEGKIIDSYALGNVFAGQNAGGQSRAGGLVGDNDGGEIYNSYSNVDVSADGEFVGGLVGKNWTLINDHESKISRSFASGNVIGLSDSVGGLVGINYTTGNAISIIEDSYATGRVVSKGEKVGGLVGWNVTNVSGSSIVKNSYSTSSMEGKSYVGGVVGRDDGEVESIFYLEQPNENDSESGEEISLEAMMRVDSFEDWNIVTGGAISSTTVGSIWLINQDVSFPYFNFATIGQEEDYTWGNGSQNYPYLVATPAQLDNVRYNLDAHYKQVGYNEQVGRDWSSVKDINLAGYSRGRGWIPIGGADEEFKGTFDGNGYRILNLGLNASSREFIEPDGLDALGSSLILWLDATDESNFTFQENGITSTSIRTWQDKSNEKHHVYQENVTWQPIYVQDAYNGRGAVRFNSMEGFDEQYLWRSTSTDSAIELGDKLTAFIVASSEEGVWSDSGVPSSNRDPHGFMFHGNLGESSFGFYLVDYDAQETLLGTGLGIDITRPNLYYMGTESYDYHFYGLNEDLGGISMQEIDRSRVGGEWNLTTGGIKANYALSHDKLVTGASIVVRSSFGQVEREINWLQSSSESGISVLGLNEDVAGNNLSISLINKVNLYVGSDDLGRGYGFSGFEGDILEYIIYDRALSRIEREGVRSYLMRKWGIDENPVGLFGLVSGVSGAAIKNVELVNVDVVGDDEVGALVGRLDEGAEIKNCYVIGRGSVFSLGDGVGGLVGTSVSGTSIKYSYTDVDVEGKGRNVGGMVGENGGLIEYSSVMGNVVGAGNVGGLVGENLTSGSISWSYSLGRVSVGTTVSGISVNVGGLVGENGGRVENCYAEGRVEGSGDTEDRIGGLVGLNSDANEAEVSKCYAVGLVVGEGDHVGGLIGEDDGSVQYAYYDSQTTGQNDSDKGEATSTSAMKMQDTFDEWDFVDENDEILWVIEDGITYPHFAFDGGKGSVLSPYRVRTAAQLNNVRNHLGGKYFVQVSDINLRGFGQGYDDDKGWEPIGTNASAFMGNFDGDMYRINNLFIDRRDESQIGLFGVIDGARLSGIGLVNVDVTGGIEVGALVGQVDGGGHIELCYASGEVEGVGDSGNGRVGGFVGYNNDGDILKSYAEVDVRGRRNQVGGFVGLNEGDIDMCYATGDVYGMWHAVGGFAGANIDEIQNSYARGDVVGASLGSGAGEEARAGGFVGTLWDGEIVNSYSTGSVTAGKNDAVGGLVGYKREDASVLSSFYYQPPFNNIGTLITEADMREKVTFTVEGWDFDEVWAIDEDAQKEEDDRINNGFPFHKYQEFVQIVFGAVGGSGVDELDFEDMGWESPLDFNYVWPHDLNVEVTLNGATNIFTVRAEGNYRRSKMTLERYFRYQDGEVVDLGGARS